MKSGWDWLAGVQTCNSNFPQINFQSIYYIWYAAIFCYFDGMKIPGKSTLYWRSKVLLITVWLIILLKTYNKIPIGIYLPRYLYELSTHLKYAKDNIFT